MEFPDLIFVSIENWDEVWRRNQFISSKLAKKFSRSKILFVGLPIDITYAIRSGKLKRITEKRTWAVKEYPNITVTRVLKFFPNSLAWGKWLNEIIARRHVRNMARKTGIKNPILWINPHYAVHMAGRMDERLVIYDITDDWTQAGFPERERRIIREEDRRLSGLADLVIVCSKALEESHKGLCKKILLLPNGVDVEHYGPVSDMAEDRISRWPRPVFGYTGTIHPDRIDISLVIALARAFPEGSVVLVGPNFLRRRQRLSLLAEKNIYLTGEVQYGEITDYMSGFDICIAPHLETGFTESLNPIKLWEYLACGKPIVSTNIAGFRDYPRLCHIASGADNFISACRDALQESGDLRRDRMAEAKKNTWDSRIEKLLEVLKPILAEVRA